MECESAVNIYIFADDCLLYREIKNNQDQIDMQRGLDALIIIIFIHTLGIHIELQ